MGRKRLELVGRVFGAIAVISAAGSDGQHSLWRVKCRCGNEAIKLGKELTKGNIKSCSTSCRYHKEAIGLANTTHGMSGHPAFFVWRSMLDRCRLPTHHAWKNYGGRGIQVCEEWIESFETFWADMGPSYRPGLTLERKNNSLGYAKENCKWATRKEQNNNRRDNIKVKTPWGELNAGEAADRAGIKRTTLLYRIEHHWPSDRLFIPADFNNRI